MACTNPEHRATTVEIEEVVVGVGHSKTPSVLSLVVVGVADQGAFPVVVQVTVGNRDEVLSIRKSLLI